MKSVRTCAMLVVLLAVSSQAGEKAPADPEALRAYETGVYSQYVHPGKDTVASQPLVDVMWELTQQQFKERPEAERKLPEGITEEDVLKRLKERVPGFPCVLVTAEEDEKIKAGTFDEAGNFIAYMDFMKILKDNGITLPPTLEILQRDQMQGKLKGLRLELAKRFAFMVIAKVYRAAEKK